jgi:hypothetical protein
MGKVPAIFATKTTPNQDRRPPDSPQNGNLLITKSRGLGTILSDD